MSKVVNCVAYEDGGRLGDISLEAISDVLQEPDTFVWVGLHEPDEPLLSKIQEEFALHELAVEDAHRAHQRPKLEAYPHSLFVVLHTAWLQGDSVQVGETHLFVGKRFLVSVRHGPSSSYAAVRERAESMPSRLAKGPGFALYAIMDFVVDNYMPLLDHFKDCFEQLETDIFHGRVEREAVGRLYDLRARLLTLRRAVAPLRDVCGQLMHFHEELIPADMHPWFRDVNDHVTRALEEIDGMLEMLAAAMQLNLALITVRQNDAVKRLAGWGAVLAIPTVVFSMYGMNFQHMPELDWLIGYPLALGLTGLGCGSLYWRLRRSGWL
jgi:magnesium transporter